MQLKYKLLTPSQCFRLWVQVPYHLIRPPTDHGTSILLKKQSKPTKEFVVLTISAECASWTMLNYRSASLQLLTLEQHRSLVNHIKSWGHEEMNTQLDNINSSSTQSYSWSITFEPLDPGKDWDMAGVSGGRETSGADRSRAPQGKNCSSRNVKTAARVTSRNCSMAQDSGVACWARGKFNVTSAWNRSFSSTLKKI